uniref:TonB-dependent receptor n=1 Tax=Ignavibacterium album TaxID=591197 RepID=A0A832DEJ3_9BACT
MRLVIKIFLTVILFFNISFAQTLKGFVYELNEKNQKVPLIGTNLYWLNTQLGTTSDENGYFELKKFKSENQSELKLVVSYIGYKPDTLSISDDMDSIEVVLSINRELSEVVVTAVSLSKFIDELDVKQTEVITSKELLKAACCNLAESFTTNASVDVQFQDAVIGAKQIQLLGLAGTYTQMMFENIPTLKGIGSTFGLNYVPGPWMTAISISKGASSVVNGYESITGQINIDYKKPDDIERFYFNAFQSSHYKTDLNANLSLQLNENLSTILLAHTDFITKTFDDDQDSFKDQPNVKQFNFFNRWKYNSLRGFESQFGVQVLNEERNGGQLRPTSSLNPDYQNKLYEININTKRLELFAKNGYVFNDEPYSSIGLILNAQKHQQNSMFGLRNYDAEQKTFYANLLFTAEDEDEINSVTLGASYVFDQYQEKFNGLDYFRKESRPGLFAEYKFAPSNLISVVPGLRVDFHNIYGTFFTPRIHLKLNPNENTTIRVSAGKGYRSVNLFADNLNYLASSRQFILINQPTYEEAWNYGFNITHYLIIGYRDLRLTADFYRTDFIKQTVVDIDSDIRQVRFFNLSGKSYSNSYQIELGYELLKRLDVTAAFRYTDVRTQIGNEILTKPLVSRYKTLVTISYANEERDWLFDSSFLLNGPGRIPSTAANPLRYQIEDKFKPYVNINAQITKKINYFDIYFGVENLTNFKQKNPIIAPDDPFGNYFDASLIWGPIDGRKFYFGLRMSIM